MPRFRHFQFDVADGQPDDTSVAVVTGKCPESGQSWRLEVPTRGLVEWMYGSSTVQRALPQLTPAERELLITGITDESWQKVFAGMDDDDDEAEDCPECHGVGRVFVEAKGESVPCERCDEQGVVRKGTV